MLKVMLVLICCDNAAEAGAAYREAQEALAAAHHEVAIRKLQEALRLEPRETDRLLFRDREGRQKLAYYPHWVWAQTCAAQARAEKNPQQKIQFLREALTHLELSDHPSAKELTEPLRRDLTALEKAVAAAPDVDPALTLLRTEIAACLDQERFEDALALVPKEHPDRPALIETIEGRRRSVLARYERAMALALETVSLASPVDKAESIPLLEAALVPPGVLRTPGAQVRWLQDFIALYKARLPMLKQLDGVKDSEALEAAQGFDEAAGKAVDAVLFPGFRASSHIADAIRESRLASLWGPGNDARLEAVLADFDRALQRREERLAAVPKEAKKSYSTQILGRLLLSCDKARERLRERRQLDQELHEWLRRAEASFADPALMSDPAPLRTLAKEEIVLEQRPRWTEAAPDVAAQVLFARSVLDLVAAFLAGESGDLLREQAGARIRQSRTLDPGVDAAWKDRLSPKVRAWIPDRNP